MIRVCTGAFASLAAGLTIEKQRQSLLELSTPVIQVWDGVLVVPLIGEIDDERAAQLTESVLTTIARTTSGHVIIDLTGVSELGDVAAAAMLRTIRAIQLLGAGCSLTGMSAGVAASLVHRDVDWSKHVRLFADLQAALTLAIVRERSSSNGQGIRDQRSESPSTSAILSGGRRPSTRIR